MSQLGQGIQVILQRQDDTGGYICQGFSGIPAVTPAFVVIASAGSPDARQEAARLHRELSTAILDLSDQVQSEAVPCGGGISGPWACHAHKVAQCPKLLVWVGDSQRSRGGLSDLNRWAKSGTNDTDYKVLPVFPTGAPVHKVLPSTVKKINATFWSRSIVEVIPTILGLLRLTSEEFRVFISYRRVDTQPLADQLFDALARVNFDVFLDRFRVPPGVDFQARLTQELADKSMVLLLESAHILDSEWTRYEIDFAKKHRLGMLALQVPGGAMVPGIDPAVRKILKPGSFRRPSGDVLTEAALRRVVERVKVEHGRALVRRRQYLRDSMEAALLRAGVTQQRIGNDGLLHVKLPSSGKDYAVLLTTRPPSLTEFHFTDTRRQKSTGLVIGPARFMMAAGKARLDWLCQVSRIQCFDEAEMAKVARRISKGRL